MIAILAMVWILQVACGNEYVSDGYSCQRICSDRKNLASLPGTRATRTCTPSEPFRPGSRLHCSKWQHGFAPWPRRGAELALRRPCRAANLRELELHGARLLQGIRGVGAEVPQGLQSDQPYLRLAPKPNTSARTGRCARSSARVIESRSAPVSQKKTSCSPRAEHPAWRLGAACAIALFTSACGGPAPQQAPSPVQSSANAAPAPAASTWEPPPLPTDDPKGAIAMLGLTGPDKPWESMSHDKRSGT